MLWLSCSIQIHDLCNGEIELNLDVDIIVLPFKLCLSLRQRENPTGFLVQYKSNLKLLVV